MYLRIHSLLTLSFLFAVESTVLPRWYREPDCPALIPDEPCFLHDCYGKGSESIWDWPPPTKRELSEWRLASEATMKTDSLTGHLRHGQNDTTSISVNSEDTTHLTTLNTRQLYPWDPKCCRTTPVCYALLESFDGRTLLLKKHPTDFDKMLCCFGLLAQSCCQDKSWEHKETPLFPKFIHPPDECTIPGQ